MFINPFEVLGLPVDLVDSETLRHAYEQHRLLWFFRQFDPQFVSHATEKLNAVEQAYHKLQDRTRQSVCLREVKSRAQLSSPAHRSSTVSNRTVKSTEPNPARAPRIKIVRRMIQEAELIARTSRSILDSADCKQIANIGFSLGLEYSNAAELADRIAKRIESERR